jgi:hypothetical protein
MDNTTYVIGYWKIPANRKRGLGHYTTLIPRTFALLKDKNVVFFYNDDKFLELVKQVCTTPNILYIKREIEDLPNYGISLDYLNSCKNQDNELLMKMRDQKGLIHYNREYKVSGEDSYRKVITVWTSKILLVEEIMNLNPFKSDRFAWVDSSAGRFNICFPELKYDDNRFTCNFGNMSYKGERIKMSASFMIGKTEIWNKVVPLYKKELETTKDSNYAHDEETILYLVYKNNKNLFAQISGDGKSILLL